MIGLIATLAAFGTAIALGTWAVMAIYTWAHRTRATDWQDWA